MVKQRKYPFTLHYFLEIISTSVDNVRSCGHGGRMSRFYMNSAKFLFYLEMLLNINGDDNGKMHLLDIYNIPSTFLELFLSINSEFCIVFLILQMRKQSYIKQYTKVT